MMCAWCVLSGSPGTDAVAVYKGDSLCLTHLQERREAVKKEWRQYLAKKRLSQKAPW